MSDIRPDHLVADRQSRLMREAAEERLARTARAGRTGGGSGTHHGPGGRLAAWSHRLAGLLGAGFRHHHPRPHPR